MKLYEKLPHDNSALDTITDTRKLQRRV